MRKALSKKIRFDIFKRDYFTCQYCGDTPPKVVLQVDHINPVKLGGTNEQDNLITSCQPCNIGKGAGSLSNIPQSLKEKSDSTAEKEAQIKGYNKILKKKQNRLESEVWQVVHVIDEDKNSISKKQFSTIKKFIESIGLYEVIDAMEIACTKNIYHEEDRFRYFCGVCYNKMRGEIS